MIQLYLLDLCFDIEFLLLQKIKLQKHQFELMLQCVFDFIEATPCIATHFCLISNVHFFHFSLVEFLDSHQSSGQVTYSDLVVKISPSLIVFSNYSMAVTTSWVKCIHHKILNV